MIPGMIAFSWNAATLVIHHVSVKASQHVTTHFQQPAIAIYSLVDCKFYLSLFRKKYAYIFLLQFKNWNRRLHL